MVLQDNSSKTRDKLEDENKELRLRLEEAEETINAIQNGEIDAIVTQGPDESKIYTLESADYLYRVLIQEMSEGVATLTSNGTIFYSNTKLASLIQLPLENLIDQKLTDFIHPDDLKTFQNIFQKGFKGAKGELNIISVDGTIIPVSISIKTLDGFQGYYAIITDLREQKYYEDLQRLTEELSASNEELQATAEELQTTNEELINSQNNLKELVNKLKISNKELEQFAYVASHDLQEPLRMVSSFTQMLEKRYKDHLDEDANEFMGFIVEGAQRMKNLIDDLLAFSRLNKEAQEFEDILMEIALEDVLTNLKPYILESNAQITHDPLPVIKADRSQINQLLQNLIFNAIKFHGDNTPNIHISVEELEKEWLFGVRDYGIGIDSDHHEKIFHIFKRLHTREQYPGTGIGLAICKRIVERHRGQIWVESEPGKGSTFYFTILKA